jgi:hypothetical protein
MRFHQLNGAFYSDRLVNVPRPANSSERIAVVNCCSCSIASLFFSKTSLFPAEKQGDGDGMHPPSETRKLGTCCVCCWLRGLLIRSWISRPRQVCFELGWWSIGQRRVQSLSIVDVFDEGADQFAGVIEITIIAAAHLLVFECLHKALRLGIGVKRALHMVTKMARKFSLSPIHSIRCAGRDSICSPCATTGAGTASFTPVPTGGYARHRLEWTDVLEPDLVVTVGPRRAFFRTDRLRELRRFVDERLRPPARDDIKAWPHRRRGVSRRDVVRRAVPGQASTCRFPGRWESVRAYCLQPAVDGRTATERTISSRRRPSSTILFRRSPQRRCLIGVAAAANP